MRIPLWCMVAMALAGCPSTSGPDGASGGGAATGGGSTSIGGGGGSGGGGTDVDGGSDAGTPIDAGEPFVQWASGTRLKAHVLRSGDAGVLVDFFDTQLGINCNFRRDRTFGYRCIGGVELGRAAGYADSNCTQELVAVPECGALDAGTLVALEAEERCIGRTTLLGYRVGAPMMPASVYARVSDGGCEANPNSGMGFQPATPVSDSQYVAATGRTSGVGPVGVLMLTGDDGSKAPFGAWSLEFGDHCNRVNARLPYDGPQPCIPGELAYDYGDFAEANQCSSTLGYSIGARGCTTRTTHLTFAYDASVDFYAVVRTSVGVEFDGGVARRDPQSGTCSSLMFGPSRFWKPSTDIVVTGDVSLGLVGGGPLKPRAEIPGPGLVLTDTYQEWFDEPHQRACTAFRTADAGTRCLPALAYRYWLDSTCQTSPVSFESAGMAVMVASNACGQFRFFSLGAVVPTPTTLYIDISGTCGISSIPDGPCHELGPELTPAAFPLFDEAVLP